MGSPFVRLTRAEDGAIVLVNLSTVLTLTFLLGENPGADPFPPAIGSRLEILAGQEPAHLTVKETPDTIAEDGRASHLIPLEPAPLGHYVNRLLITHVEPVHPGAADVHLVGRPQPLRVLNGADEVARRAGADTPGHRPAAPSGGGATVGAD